MQVKVNQTELRSYFQNQLYSEYSLMSLRANHTEAILMSANIQILVHKHKLSSHRKNQRLYIDEFLDGYRHDDNFYS